MCTRRLVAVLAVAALAGCAAARSVEGPNLGQPASPAEIAAWDISIPPDGAGLPAGSGTAARGAVVYAEKCQACHGDKGAGQPNDRLVGGHGTLTSASPVRTIGSYWPYATTVFDYVRRSMPYGGIREHGLNFVAFGESLDRFERQLRRMAGRDDGVSDGILAFTRAVSGAYYFCPPLRQGRCDLGVLGA